MWQMEARVTSKLRDYDPGTHNAVIDDGSILRGRIEKDAQLAWLASGSFFEVVCARSGHRIAAHYFGGHDGDLTITAVQYLAWSKGRGFVVGLESKNNFGSSWGLLCLYHLGKSRVIRAVELPAQVKALEIVSNIGGANCNTHHLHQHLRWLFGVVALVTHRGWIYLLDLCLDIPLDQSDEANRAGIHLVRASATNLPMLRQRAMAESLHICVELQAGAIQSIAGSALHYAPRTNQLAVGFENGVFQLWDMSSLQQVFQSNLPKATVCAFALQEPENDPRNCCYLWTVQTLPGINKEIILHMFQMEFKERTSSSSANIFFKGLNVCKQRYTQILSAEVSAEQGKHAVCSLLGCHVVERYRHGFSDASLREESSPNTSVVIFVWETAKNHTSQPTITLGLFDINRWYRAQMPTHLSRKELNSYFAVWSLNSLLAEAPSQYVLDTIVHEHSLTHGTPTIYPPPEAFFCPSSFSFDITCLLDGGVIHLTCPGLQHEVLNSLSCAAPLSADSLCVAYDRCATAGLLSPHFADISPSNLSWEEKMEAVLMAVLRSGHLTMFTKTVRAWAAAGNLDSVNKLCFLLQWTWNKVVLTKEEIDNLCMPLFDGSSRVADPLALSLLGRADARLQNLKSILNLFLKEAPALIDIEDVGCKTNVIVLLSHYILMVMWFCHAHLLPEIPEEYGGWDAEPIVYRWSDLHKYYTSRRQQLSEGARLRWQADCLLIDHMVACGGEKLAKLWQRDEGGTGKYPPRTLHALLDICLLEEVAMDEKNAIVTYFLLDIVYNGEQQHTFVLEDFTVAVGLPAGPRQRTHAFWLFDHKEFQNALETFQPGYPGWEEPWQHICILQALVCQSETALAMRYVFDFAPKPICDDDIKLHLSVLLANRKVVAAWRILNHRGSFAVSRELFWHFFQTCISENLMHHVITFPLTSMQQKYLVEFLRDNTQPKSQELLWLYHMQEANYLAAFRLHQNMRYGLAAGCGPAAHERYMLRNCIMEQYAHVLPCVQRKLTLDRLRPYPKSKHVTCDVVPRPLSTVRPAKGKIMLRSTFLSHLLSKMQEVHSGLSQEASSIIEEKNENIMCSKTLGDFLDTPLRQSCILNQKLTNEVTASPSVKASPATAITLFSSFRNRLNSLQHSLQDLHSSLPQQDISQLHSITVELLQTPPVVRQHPLVNRTTKDEVFPSSNLHIQLFAKMATPERPQDPQRHSEVWFGKLRQEPKLFPDTQTVPQTSQEQHPLVNTATKDEVFPSSNLRTQPFTKMATSERPQDPQCRSEGWIGKLWQERDLFPNTRTVPQMSQEEKPADEEEPSTSGFTRKPVRSAVEMPLYHHSGSSPSKVDMTFINHPEGFHTQTSLGHRPQSFHLSTVKETMESSLCGRQTTAGFSFLEDLAPVKSPKSPSSRAEGVPQHDTWDSAAEGFIKPRKPLHPDSADSMVFEAKPTPEETMQLQLADDESTDNSSTEDADNASECDDEGISTGMEEEAVLPEEAVVSSGSLCAADVMTGSKLFAPEQKVQHLSSSTSKIEDAVHDLQYTTSEEEEEEEEEKEDDDDDDYDTPIDDKNEEFHLHLPLTEEEEDEEIENLKPEDTSNLSALQVDQSSVDASPSDAALPSDTASTSDTALPSDTASLSLTEVSVKSIRDSTVAPSPASVIGKDCTMETLQQKTPKRQQGVTGQTPLSRRRSMRLLSISHCDAEGQLKSLSTSKSNEVINLATPRRSHRFRKNLFSKSTPAGMKEDSNDVLRENRQDSRRSSFRPATDTPKSNSKLLLSLPLMTPSPAVHSISTQTSKSRHTPFEEQGLAGQAATPAKREKVTFVFSPPVTRSCARQRAAAQAATEPLLEYTFSPPHLNPANRTKDGVEEVQRSTGRKQKVKASAEKSVKKNRNKALMIDEELNLISPLASPAMWPRRGKQPRKSMNNRMTLRNRTLWPRPVTRRKLGPTKKAPEGSGS